MHISNYTFYCCQLKASKKIPYLKNHARSTHFWETKQMANTVKAMNTETEDELPFFRTADPTGFSL